MMNEALLYSKYNGLQKRDAAYILENYYHLIKWVPEGNDSILDVGCGSGDVTLQLLLPLLPDNFNKLVGADISRDMVQFAKAQNTHTKVHFRNIDLSSKEILVDLEEEFDHVFSFYCLHWIQDQSQVLRNLYHTLKPGGDMMLTFLASNPIFHIYEMLSKYTKWMKYMKDYKKYVSPYQNCKSPARTLEKRLNEAGFNSHLCKVEEMKYVYSDINCLRKSVIAVNPFIRDIPDSEQNDYLADFFDEIRKLNFIQYTNNNEDKITVPYKLFVVYASKPY